MASRTNTTEVTISCSLQWIVRAYMQKRVVTIFTTTFLRAGKCTFCL